jgi:VIT1/CCC1 family predicted Fe2+/Mn2+ transporter
MDGVLTAFAVVSGGAGGNLSPHVVLVLGLSGLTANAISMGIGDAVSTLSYQVSFVVF